MQAILFGKPELQIFASDPVRKDTLNHIGRVVELAAALGAQALVFGSPRNRDRGELSPDEAFASAIDFFREAGRICAAHDVWLCIEPLPEAYGSNFVMRWREAADLVLAVDVPGFGLHLDTGCIHMAGDDPAEAVLACAGMIRHFHVSEPHLVGLSRPVVDHHRIGEALHRAGYYGWISIEMRRADHPLECIGEAVRRVSLCYGDV
jgi:sugar phosphate isomerase/epimerase